jgi:hypothetical protein
MIEPGTGVEPSVPRHETGDPNARPAVIFLVVLFVSVAATLLACWGIFRYIVRTQPLGAPAAPYAHARAVTPAPLLQVAPRQDAKAYLQHENRILNTYGWVDRQQGVVRIPIQQAMNLLLKQGLPAVTAATPRNQQPLKQDEVLQYTVPAGYTPQD